jgi:hypothetical protein
MTTFAERAESGIPPKTPIQFIKCQQQAGYSKNNTNDTAARQVN